MSKPSPDRYSAVIIVSGSIDVLQPALRDFANISRSEGCDVILAADSGHMPLEVVNLKRAEVAKLWLRKPRVLSRNTILDI